MFHIPAHKNSQNPPGQVPAQPSPVAKSNKAWAAYAASRNAVR